MAIAVGAQVIQNTIVTDKPLDPLPSLYPSFQAGTYRATAAGRGRPRSVSKRSAQSPASPRTAGTVGGGMEHPQPAAGHPSAVPSRLPADAGPANHWSARVRVKLSRRRPRGVPLTGSCCECWLPLKIPLTSSRNPVESGGRCSSLQDQSWAPSLPLDSATRQPLAPTTRNSGWNVWRAPLRFQAGST